MVNGRKMTEAGKSFLNGGKTHGIRIANYVGGYNIRAAVSLKELFPDGCKIRAERAPDGYKITMLNRAGGSKFSVRNRHDHQFLELNLKTPSDGLKMPLFGTVVPVDLEEIRGGCSFLLPGTLPTVRNMASPTGRKSLSAAMGTKPHATADKAVAEEVTLAAPEAAEPVPTAYAEPSLALTPCATIREMVATLNAEKRRSPDSIVMTIKPDGTLHILAEYS